MSTKRGSKHMNLSKTPMQQRRVISDNTQTGRCSRLEGISRVAMLPKNLIAAYSVHVLKRRGFEGLLSHGVVHAVVEMGSQKRNITTR